MKHTIKTPQGTLTIEPVSDAGLRIDSGIRVTVKKMPFPEFLLTIRVEDAQVVHVALGMVLKELKTKVPA